MFTLLPFTTAKKWKMTKADWSDSWYTCNARHYTTVNTKTTFQLRKQ